MAPSLLNHKSKPYVDTFLSLTFEQKSSSRTALRGYLMAHETEKTTDVCLKKK